MTKEEAIEVYKELINPRIKEAFETFAPELKESKDESIRKAMIKYFTNGKEYLSLTPYSREDYIAWLEKQGDIPTDAVLDSNKDGLIADTIQSKPKFKVGDKIYLKPEYRMPDDDTPIANTVKEIRRIDDKYYRFDRSYIFIEDQDKYELVEQKPADTEKGAKGNDREIPNSAWSEEDEKVLDNILYILNQLKDTTPHKEDETAKECIDKLKSLRHQNTWKPSDAQMESIRQAVSNMKNSACYDSVLVHLLRDLEKLREE